jgi:two-component system OmpR family response regulator
VTISRMTTHSTRSGPGGRTGGPARVLVVDDEPALTDLLATALGWEGWHVRSASDGWTAVQAAREFQPDAVVLDVLLPDSDGLEVLRHLRAGAPRLPVLLLTARDAVEDRVRGFEAGGDDYMTKPFSLADIVDRLVSLMSRPGGPF